MSTGNENYSNSTAASVKASAPLRRSSRRTAQRQERSLGPIPAVRGLPITAFRRPWVQHYIDIGHCRLNKCTQRIQQAKSSDIEHLPISFLAMAIKASTAYGPKWKQEQALIEYTRAVMLRGIPPNDFDERLGSAVSMAAYFGYAGLLQFLLVEASCPVVTDHHHPDAATPKAPHAFFAAVKNSQRDCLRILIQERPDELETQLYRETLASWPVGQPTTLSEAFRKGDLDVIRWLQQKKAMLLVLKSCDFEKRATSILRQLHQDENNVKAWCPHLHWSFPGADRRMLNWLWHALQTKRQQSYREPGGNCTVAMLPSEVWLRVFGFIGRGFWNLSTLKDQNGYQYTHPSMRK